VSGRRPANESRRGTRPHQAIQRPRTRGSAAVVSGFDTVVPVPRYIAAHRPRLRCPREQHDHEAPAPTSAQAHALLMSERQMAAKRSGSRPNQLTIMPDDSTEPDAERPKDLRELPAHRSRTATIPTDAMPTPLEEPPDSPPTAEEGPRQASTEETGRSPRTNDLALNRTIAGALGALVLAVLGLATPLGISRWLKTWLAIVGLLALAVVLVLSILEWRTARRSIAADGRSRRRRLAISAGVIGLMLLVVGLAIRHGRDAARAEESEDVPYDTTVGSGPYNVNGTCWNHTCVLYERRAPTAASVKIARLSEGQKLTIVCQTRGGTVRIPRGSSNVWDRLYDEHSGPYVSDYFTTTPGTGGLTSSISRCPHTDSSTRSASSP
jgi:hypothetical protein